MCGILGAINMEFDEHTLSIMEHRGPDDSGITSFLHQEHKVIFGQRRLSIIDVSTAGHQPMVSASNKFAIIFNGEIYNHLKLREKLPKQIVYNGHSDTETILYYLIHFGIESVSDFNGIFSLAFHDRDQGKIFLARDSFGVKPLYYYKNRSQFVFASEIRPIKALLGRTETNINAIASLLRLRYNASPETLHEGVLKVVPGHYLELNLNSKTIQVSSHYFGGELPKIKIKDADVLVKQYGIELEKAVKRQLLSDVEVGVLLSGGIDSAVVAFLAKKHYKGRLKAFTVGFEGENEEDEIKEAKETAALLGLEHHIKKISFSDFLGLIKECSRIVEEPLATTSMIPMFYLAKLSAEHVKVVLTGQGADEPLGGYTRYKSEIIRDKVPSFLRSAIKPIVKILGFKNEQVIRGAKVLGIDSEMDRFISVYEIFSSDEIMELIGVDDSYSKKVVTNFNEILNCNSRENSVEKMMAIDTRMNLSDDLLNYTDKITMNFSIECRVPMLDIELVKFMETLPLDLKISSKEGKIIHKEFAKNILPERIINRSKKGFKSPTNRWFREEIKTLEIILLAKGTEFSKRFNLVYVSKILKSHLDGFNKEKQIFLLLSIYYWLETNISE